MLDTYHDERHAVGLAMAEQAVVRNRIRHGHATEQVRAQMVDDIVITLGYRYHSRAVVTEQRRPVLADPLDLNGEPGTRAPHVWLDHGCGRLSTIDLFWDSFVLLTGSQGREWHAAAAQLAQRVPIPLRPVAIGQAADHAAAEAEWARAYGVSPRGAVLVRPDGFVAWRSTGSLPEPRRVLADVLHRVTGTATVGAVAC